MFNKFGKIQERKLIGNPKFQNIIKKNDKEQKKCLMWQIQDIFIDGQFTNEHLAKYRWKATLINW